MFAYVTAKLLLAMAGGAYDMSITHGNRALEISYEARPVIKMRQIGQDLPNRPGTARCVWTAALPVTRTVTEAGTPVAALTRSFETGAPVEGSRAGPCASARRLVERDALARLDRGARMSAFAAADRDRLETELAGLAAR